MASTSTKSSTLPPARPTFARRRGPVPLEAIRALAANDAGVALVLSGSVALLSSGEKTDEVLFLEAPGVALAAPFGPESAVFATRDGDLSLASALAERAQVCVPGEGREPIALAAHHRTRQVAVATGADAVWHRLTLPGDQHQPEMSVLAEPRGTVTGLAFDERGERLAVAAISPDGAGQIAVYRLLHAPRLETVIDAEAPLGVAWLSKTALAAATVHGEVAVLDAKTGARLRSVEAAAFDVLSLARVPRDDGDLLLSLGDDRALEPGERSGAIVVKDGEGKPLSFPKKRRPRLLGFRVADLTGQGEATPRLDLDAVSGEALR